jgi:hypothetical protein
MRNLNLLVVAVLLVASLYLQIVPTNEPHVNAAVETPASAATDAEIERQIADLLLASYQTGHAVDEDPHLWELIRQLEPDQTFVLGQ